MPVSVLSTNRTGQTIHGQDQSDNIGENREKWDTEETRLDYISYKIAFELNFSS